MRFQNKSGLCSYHLRLRNQKLQRKRKREKICNRCGIECSGKILIELKKNYYYGFCSSCFAIVKTLSLKEIKKLASCNYEVIR
ncbi:MAG: hypothetical protein ACTSUG_00250 [Candidatus Helarchaeota archaeon]